MEDWEEEAIPSKKERGKSSWDDEDGDEDDVKESWEDYDEPMESVPEPKIAKNISLTPVAAEEDNRERLLEDVDFRSKKDVIVDKSDEKTLQNFIPKSETDFSEYAQLISRKLHLYENSFHYIELLKAVMKLSTTGLKAGDAKEVASSITTIANEKVKSEKDANSVKTKTGAKKKQLQVEKTNEDVIVDAHDTYDD